MVRKDREAFLLGIGRAVVDVDHGKPALLYDIESKGAQAYLELAQELISRAEARA